MGGCTMNMVPGSADSGSLLASPSGKAVGRASISLCKVVTLSELQQDNSHELIDYADSCLSILAKPYASTSTCS